MSFGFPIARNKPRVRALALLHPGSPSVGGRPVSLCSMRMELSVEGEVSANPVAPAITARHVKEPTNVARLQTAHL
jgi:hypothetical protein